MHLLGRAMEKEFWQEVREKECFEGYRYALIEDWKKLGEGKSPLLALRYSEFKLFWVTGNRSIYQDSYGTHRQAVTVSAILSLIYPENEEYLDFLMDAIYTLCDAYTWCLPAHQPSLEENNNCHIDLCASANAYYLAEIYTLLEDRLDPLIKSRIRAEIDRRVFDPFLAKEPYWWWETGTSNWTAVCMGSVACAFMLLEPEKARELIPRFEKSMKGFISGFTEEGVCLEGGSYWNYGFGNFLFYADMIRTFTNGEIDHFKNPKIRLVATFYDKLFLTGRVVANFADCACGLGHSIGRMHYIKKEYPDDLKSSGCKDSSFSHDLAFPHRLREALWFFEESDEETNDRYFSEFYAPIAGWLIKRTPSYGFAAKGGHNAEHHNHNDIGHFIYAKDGRQILCDLGSQVYEKDYFGPKRYTFLSTSSRGHSVPIIDGEYQKPGKEFCAGELKYENGVFSLEISHAYGLDEDERIERSFITKDDSVTLTDRFSFPRPRTVVERLVSLIEPDISTRGIVLLDGTVISYDADSWSVSVCTDSYNKNREVTVYLIDFEKIGDTDEFVCHIK